VVRYRVINIFYPGRSLKTKQHNGGKNGGKKLDIGSKEEFNMLYENGGGNPINIRAPGIWRLPVCGADEAYRNWETSKDHKPEGEAEDAESWYWPCDKP